MKIPVGVTSIGDDAFSGCSRLSSVEIPESVTSIGRGAFKGCSGLTSVEIPESVTSIGRGAFKGCSKLTSVKIPSSVTSIGNSAFRECSGLTSVTFRDTSEWYVTESYVDAAKKAGGGKVVKLPFIKPTENAELVKAAFGWYWYKQK